MKILMASHYFEAHRGGVEIAAGQLARALARLGHRVTWAACGCDPPPGDPAVCDRAVPLPAVNSLERRTGIPYPLPLPLAAAQFIDEVRSADLVIVHDGSYVSSVIAHRTAQLVGVPIVLIQHIGLVPYRNPVLRVAMRVLTHVVTRPALAAADQVVFISDLTRRHFANVRFGRAPLMVFNGVDTAVFRPPEPGSDGGAIRRSLGLLPERPMVLFVGRFVEKKGLCHLKRMAERRPDWNWVLAGWGPIDPIASHLPNVHIVSGRSGAQLATLYQAADALVLPSVGEGYPLVIQEALACGLPVVCGADTATADPAAGPFLVGAECCVADTAATADRFIAALAPFVAAPVLDTERRVRAEFARTRYSWDEMARRLIAHAPVSAVRQPSAPALRPAM